MNVSAFHRRPLPPFIEGNLRDGRVSATALVVGHRGVVVLEEYLGTTRPHDGRPIDHDSLFDVQSITKVVATLPAVFRLLADNHLRLTDRVASVLPAFAAQGKDHITIHDLLSFSSGLPSEISAPRFTEQSREDLWAQMYDTSLEYSTGQGVRYSDLSYRILGRLVETVASEDLATFAGTRVWQPLGMHNTYFNPPRALHSCTVGTNQSTLRGRYLQGEVADELDFHLGGVAGCDGVFTTARDLAHLACVFLQGGRHHGKQFFPADLVDCALRTMSPPIQVEGQEIRDSLSYLRHGPKSYGWEVARAPHSYYGTRASACAVGKAGGAGTFMLIDPEHDVIAVYLTNHGLPVPFNPGWNLLTETLHTGELFDWVIDSIW